MLQSHVWDSLFSPVESLGKILLQATLDGQIGVRLLAWSQKLLWGLGCSPLALPSL